MRKVILNYNTYNIILNILSKNSKTKLIKCISLRILSTLLLYFLLLILFLRLKYKQPGGKSVKNIVSLDLNRS